MAKAQTIPPEVVAVLDQSEITGNSLVLPPVQLERKLYVAVAKVIECLGGKWDRKTKSHLFPFDPAEAIEGALLSGKVTNQRQALGFFATPAKLAEQLVKMAELRDSHRVLEPSAGTGNIARAIDAAAPRCGLRAIEINPQHERPLRQAVDCDVVIADFLQQKPTADFDRIVANPPFGGAQRDIDHVLHMHGFLKPGGVLVSVMADGVRWRDNRKSQAFREFVAENGGRIDPLPAKSFAESGTDVNTCVVMMRKGAA